MAEILLKGAFDSLHGKELCFCELLNTENCSKGNKNLRNGWLLDSIENQKNRLKYVVSWKFIPYNVKASKRH